MRFGWHVGRRGAFLLFLALLDIISAVGLAFPTARSVNNPTTVFLASLMPMWAWGVLWALVGFICLFFAFRRKDSVGFAAAMFLKVLWAAMFLLGWLFADVERGYLAFVIWGAFAGVVKIIEGWQENPRPAEPVEVT